MLASQLPNHVWAYISNCENEGYIPSHEELDEKFGKKIEMEDLMNAFAYVSQQVPNGWEIDHRNYVFAPFEDSPRQVRALG